MCFRENLLLLTLEALTSILCPEIFDQIFIFLNNSWWSNALGSFVKFLFSVFVTRYYIFHHHKVYFCCVPNNILFPFVEFLEKERHASISWGTAFSSQYFGTSIPTVNYSFLEFAEIFVQQSPTCLASSMLRLVCRDHCWYFWLHSRFICCHWRPYLCCNLLILYWIFWLEKGVH